LDSEPEVKRLTEADKRRIAAITAEWKTRGSLIFSRRPNWIAATVCLLAGGYLLAGALGIADMQFPVNGTETVPMKWDLRPPGTLKLDPSTLRGVALSLPADHWFDPSHSVVLLRVQITDTTAFTISYSRYIAQYSAVLRVSGTYTAVPQNIYVINPSLVEPKVDRLNRKNSLKRKRAKRTTATAIPKDIGGLIDRSGEVDTRRLQPSYVDVLVRERVLVAQVVPPKREYFVQHVSVPAITVPVRDDPAGLIFVLAISGLALYYAVNELSRLRRGNEFVLTPSVFEDRRNLMHFRGSFVVPWESLIATQSTSTWLAIFLFFPRAKLAITDRSTKKERSYRCITIKRYAYFKAALIVGISSRATLTDGA
jgi:hypothetical protein